MVIMKSYGVITRSYKRERKGVGTIGLDWLGRGMAVSLGYLAWLSIYLIPYSPLS